MIHKILLSALLVFAALPAHAEIERYCIPSDKLVQLRDNIPSADPYTQHAYGELLNIMTAANESGDKADAGCISPQDLAQACKKAWENDSEKCKTFVHSIVTPTKTESFKQLTYSNILQRTDFSDIDPDIFQKAVNQRVENRGRYKNIPTVLQDTGNAFLENAKEQQINPFLFVAIAMYESSYGTSKAARNKNNIGGLADANERQLSYTTVEDSIKKQAETIKKWSSSKTLEGLGRSGHYCRKKVAAQWSRDISSIAKTLHKYYNNLLQNE